MTSNARKKQARRLESTALVHQTAADLVFKYAIQGALNQMAEMCKGVMREVFDTKQYQNAMRGQLEAHVANFDARLPDEPDGAGVEFHWEPPVIGFDSKNDRYVMVPYRDRDGAEWPLPDYAE